jgi:hypothetical protein
VFKEAIKSLIDQTIIRDNEPGAALAPGVDDLYLARLFSDGSARFSIFQSPKTEQFCTEIQLHQSREFVRTSASAALVIHGCFSACAAVYRACGCMTSR